MYTASTFGPPLILNSLVKHFEGTTILPDSILGIYVALMFVIPTAGSVFSSESNNILSHCGIQFRNALIGMIYRKSLRLSSASRHMASTGQIVNMFSNDTAQLQKFMSYLSNLVLVGPTIGLSLYLIYLQVGVSTFVGLGLIVLVIPFNALIFKWINDFRKKKIAVTDIRVKGMNEILNGIRVIKFYAWERAFSERVTASRAEELQYLRMLAYIVAIAFSLALVAVPVFLPVVVFFMYIKLGNQLDAATAFTAISLFNLMRMPFNTLPLGEDLLHYYQANIHSRVSRRFCTAVSGRGICQAHHALSVRAGAGSLCERRGGP